MAARWLEVLARPTHTRPKMDDAGYLSPVRARRPTHSSSTTQNCTGRPRVIHAVGRRRLRGGWVASAALPCQGVRAKLADYSAAAGGPSVCWGKGRAGEGARRGGRPVGGRYGDARAPLGEGATSWAQLSAAAVALAPTVGPSLFLSNFC
ncbi:hypothetical protein HPB47_009365 [Ixodes persulcatus]|uniref:Uncharacterized protein n=1 Tax=Ixodes persulcatus TaxID=34615 RepID=A0AC60P2F3_IXOPE|nr:hypothetical protein HPB47_009365 [Ixodes persulcatus]